MSTAVERTSASSRLGPAMLLVGVGCASGLALVAFGLAGSSGWEAMHNHVGMFLVGVVCILVAPIWVLAAAIASFIHRRAPWRAWELPLVVGVIALFLLAVVRLR